MDFPKDLPAVCTHDAEEWYITEVPARGVYGLSVPPVRLGPFATRQECLELLDGLRQIPRFSSGNLAICKGRNPRERRIRIELPVEVHRASRHHEAEACHTVNVSNRGLCLSGLRLPPPGTGEDVAVLCGRRTARFRVVWIGAPESPSQGQVGLELLAGEPHLLDFDLAELSESDPLQQHLELARAVQRKLFPQEIPSLRTLVFAGDCIQAHAVGGDYYDFFPLTGGELAFVLADVSGKGIAAALLMANLQGSLHSRAAATSKDLWAWLTAVNRHFYTYTDTTHYATLFLGCYNDRLRRLHYINCGHTPPFLLRQDSSVEVLEATATVLGLFRDWDCSVADVQLTPGDLLCFYTDGITETFGHNEIEFGSHRLLQALLDRRDLDPPALLLHLERTVQQFRQGEQRDDLTLLVARAR